MAASTPKAEKEMKVAVESIDKKIDKLEKKFMDGMNRYLEKHMEKMLWKMEDSFKKAVKS